MTEAPQADTPLWTLTAPDGQTWQGKSKTEVFEMARQSRDAIEKAAKAP